MALGLGIIGCGVMGRELGEAVRQGVPEAELALAFDPYRPNLERFCADFGARPAETMEALFGSDEVQAVVIASPNNRHCEQTVAAAEAGKHVFCEKPMALSVVDCDRMIAACDGAGAKLMVGHSTRLYPLTRRLIEIAGSGELGEPLFAFASYHFFGFNQRASGVWHLDRANSGGLFFHMGIHYIDLLNAIMGPARRVQYAGGKYGQQVRDFDDVASITIEFESAKTGLLTVSSLSRVHWRESVFVFSNGFARLDHPWSYLEYGDADDRLTRVEPKDLPPQNAVQMELRSFTAWVLHGEPPVFTGKEGRAAVAVAEAADRAKESGGPVEVMK